MKQEPLRPFPGRATFQSLAALLLVIAFATRGLASERFHEWLPISDSTWAIAPNESLGSLHAAILFDGHIVDDKDIQSGITVISFYRRIRVFDERGRESYGSVTVPFDDDEKLWELKARTVKPDGRVIPVNDDEMHDKSILSFGGRHEKARVFAFKGVELGDIVEYFGTREAPWGNLPLVQFQHRDFTAEATLNWHFVDFSRSPYVPAWIIANGATFLGSVEQLPDTKKPRQLRVSFRNLPALPDEPFQPPEQLIAARLYGHYVRPDLEEEDPYWERVADEAARRRAIFLGEADRLEWWMKEIERRPRVLSADLADCVARIHAEIDNELSFPPGEGPDEIKSCRTVNNLLALKIGTSENINLLLVKMLQRLGYDASIFWAADRSRAAFVKEWEATRQFWLQGVVVKKKQDRVDDARWVFPAIPVAVTAGIPWQAQGSGVLIENLGSGKTRPFPATASVPIQPAEANTVDQVIDVTAYLDGKLRGRMVVTRHCTSEFDEDWAPSRISETNVDDALKKLALREGQAWNAFEETTSTEGFTRIYACSLEATGLVETAGARVLVALGQLRVDDYRIPEGARHTDIHLPYPVIYRSKVSLSAPAGYAIESIPADSTATSSFAEFTSRWERSGGTNDQPSRITRERSLRIAECLFTARTAPTLRDYFAAVYKSDAVPVVLKQALAAEGERPRGDPD
ncbi:MAG: DUF3857 domain-containing protein [bacterium]